MNGVSALVNEAPQNPPHPTTWGHRRRLSENLEEGPPDKESASRLRSSSPRGRGQTPGPEGPDVWTHMCAHVLRRSVTLSKGHFININSAVVAKDLLRRFKDTHYTVSLFPKEIPRI